MSRPLRIVLLAAMAALTGCAGIATRGASATLDCSRARDDARCDALISNAMNAARADSASWAMQGRAAVRRGRDGGSVRVDWQAQPGAQTVTLSVPVTRQSVVLDIGPGGTTLSGLPDGPRSGPDAQVLLRQATGWEIPVGAMRYWLRGHPDPDVPTAGHRFDPASGQLRGFIQQQWIIEYPARGADGLPRQVVATRGEDQVRLIVDSWSAQTP